MNPTEGRRKDSIQIGVVSDIHYATTAEKARGNTELAVVSRRWLRLGIRAFRHWIWMRHPHEHDDLFARFLEEAPRSDHWVANGDYTSDTAFVGLSDPVTFDSARDCLAKLRARFGDRVLAGFGDHEFGKMSLAGRQGGPRLASFMRGQSELGLRPFWRLELGRYTLMGIASTLVAWPIYEPETLPDERVQWQACRAQHLDEIQQAFRQLKSQQRIVLFCHDPTALPFLAGEEAVRGRLDQIELTFLGHLHSEWFLRISQCLAGFPAVRCFGNAVRRMSTALQQARHWHGFKVRLCPSLAGIELLKDGGYYTLSLDPEARRPLTFTRHRLPWT